MAIDTHIYYLPFYFQTVKGTTARGSGVRFIPYLVSMNIAALMSGILVTKTGIFVPLMWVSAAVMSIGCGLIYSLNSQSSTAQWFLYEVVTGTGFGIGNQVPYTVVQVTLSESDRAVGNSLVILFQTLGGTLAISIAQNIMTSTLKMRLDQTISNGSQLIISAGAADISERVASELQPTVRSAYDDAISAAFILPIVAVGIAFLCSLAMKRLRIPKSSSHDPI